jgi:glutamyl-tRNA reductase
LKKFHVIAYTFKTLDFQLIGHLNTPEDQWEFVLPSLKEHLNADELMIISTCNRVEFLIVCNQQPCPFKLLNFYKPSLSKDTIGAIASKSELFSGKIAIEHLFRVASSLDSLVVGEREIITQVRESYEKCNFIGVTGDSIRLAIKQTIETAKKIFSETNISTKQVSVVSLAFQSLMEFNPNTQSRVIVVGAGVTNTNMLRFLKKNNFTDVTIFNRTLEKAQALAKEFSYSALPLEDLKNWTKGFDVLITCTNSEFPVITGPIFEKLSKSETTKKIVVDLSLPNDIEDSLIKTNAFSYIHFNQLKEKSEENLLFRQQEIAVCEKIIEECLKQSKEVFKIREVELAMQEIPRLVKEIKENAMSLVFAKDLAKLDSESREVVEKIMEYVEKKYISLPIKKAKEILLEKV